MISVYLSASRKAEEERVSLNPCTITVRAYTMIDDGFGGTIQDTQSPYTTSNHIVRISSLDKPLDVEVNDNQVVKGIGTKYLLSAPYDAGWLTKGLLFTFNGNLYRTDSVVDVRKFGGTICKHCVVIIIGEDNA